MTKFSNKFGGKPSGPGGPGGPSGGSSSGFGKAALGVGAGLLLGGVLEHAWDKHHVGGGGQQSDDRPQQQSSGGLFGGFGSALGFGPPTLTILSANYGGIDVTTAARDLVTPENTMSFVNNSYQYYDGLFTNPWNGPMKSLCILYQFGNRPIELLVSAQQGGAVALDPDEPVRPTRTQFIAGEGPVICVVWGIMQNRDGPVPRNRIKEIASYKSFEATNQYFGFDGWAGESKTCVVFYRNGDKIYNIGVREGNVGRL
jgi:hypothetical protein